MNEVRVLKQFVTEAESRALSAWIFAHKDSKLFSDANMGGKRVTTRFSEIDGWSYPQEAYEVRARLFGYLNLGDFLIAPYPDGMVASYAYPGDHCYKHLDPEFFYDHVTFHCNVVVSEPESGATLNIGGVDYAMPKNDVVCYPVSKVPHSVGVVEGKLPRLMWVFGFCVSRLNA